jgi:hypothetical protein
MANFERAIVVSVDSEEVCNLQIKGTETDGRIDIVVRHKRGPTGAAPTVRWTVDWEKKTISTDVTSAFGLDPQTSCVAACLVGAAGSLADCLLRAKSQADVWDCVEKNAVTAVFSGLGCVLACF